MQASDLKTFQDLIAAGQTGDALDVLAQSLSKSVEDKAFLDECLKIQAQQFQLKQDEIRGILSPSELDQRRNLINHRLFELRNQIERGEKPGGLSFQKQNPLLFYALHVVASLAICGLLGYFVNDGFVSGREEWELAILEKGKWFGNLVLALLLGIIPAAFAIMSCFQFFPFMVETGFSKEIPEKLGYVFYGNALYYIVPSKFMIFHQLVVLATISFFLVFIFALWLMFCVYFLIESLAVIFSWRQMSFSEFVRNKKGTNGMVETFAKHPFLCSFCILIAFFAYYAVGHPVAVTIYNFL